MELKFKLFFYLIFNVLIIHVLTQKKGLSLRKTEEFTVDLKKNEKITVSSSKEKIIFDSSEFKKDENIYFKITAEVFKEKIIEFEFLDNLIGYKIIAKNLKSVYYTIEDNKFFNEEKYYTIKKTSQNLDPLEGKYLLIKFYCAGDVEIENIENLDNIKKSHTEQIVTIIVLAIIVIGIIIYCCYKKKKKTQIYKKNITKKKNKILTEKEIIFNFK